MTIISTQTFRCAVLCCDVLCCAVLCCVVLCCVVLCCVVLCCVVLCCVVLCCVVLCCVVLCCVVLCCVVTENKSMETPYSVINIFISNLPALQVRFGGRRRSIRNNVETG